MADAAAPEKPEAATAEKPEAANGEATEVVIDARVKKQVEFYFSDSNLPKDKFLLTKVKASKEGWVEIALLCTFKRMQEFKATVEMVAAVAKQCIFLEASEDGKQIRRTTELPESDVTIARSIAAKGITSDAPVGELIDDLSAFFGAHGTVLSVRIDGGHGKQSEKKQDAKKEGGADGAGGSKKEDGAEADAKKEDGAEADAKKEDGAEADVKNEDGAEADAKKEDGSEADAKKEGRNEADVKKEDWAETDTKKDGAEADAKPEKEAKKKEDDKPAAKNVFIEFSTKEEAEAVCAKTDIEYKGSKLDLQMKTDYIKSKADDGKKRGRDDKHEKPETRKRQRTDDNKDDAKPGPKEYVSYPKGVFVKVANVTPDTPISTIKDLFGKYGVVKFVEFREGDADACVRFENPDDAAEAVKGEQEAKTEIGGSVPEVSLITGEEEEKKLEEIKQKQMNKINQGGRGGRGGRGGSRGGRGGSRGGGRGGFGGGNGGRGGRGGRGGGGRGRGGGGGKRDRDSSGGGGGGKRDRDSSGGGERPAKAQKKE